MPEKTTAHRSLSPLLETFRRRDRSAKAYRRRTLSVQLDEARDIREGVDDYRKGTLSSLIPIHFFNYS